LEAYLTPASRGGRYLRADYTEMAVSATIIVRSALSVLLEEVKSEGMRGNAETVLEMFETVMLSLKPNDDAFHKQVVALLQSHDGSEFACAQSMLWSRVGRVFWIGADGSGHGVGSR
jgi:hypothetical protein